MRCAESDPHWTAYKAINERWNPLVNAAQREEVDERKHTGRTFRRRRA